MAVIRDIMPAFELFQPATADDAMKLARPARRRRLGAGRRARQLRLAEGSHQAAQGGGRSEPDQGAAAASADSSDGLEIGAMTTLTEVVRHPDRARRSTACCRRAPKRRPRRRSATRERSAATCRRTRAAGITAAAGSAIARAATSASPIRRRPINREHAILGADRCVAVNPSDTAPALIALDAKMVIRNAEGRAGGERRGLLHRPGHRHHAHDRAAAGRSADRHPHSRPLGPARSSISRRCATGNVWDFPLMNVASAMVVIGRQDRAHPHRGERRGRASAAAEGSGRRGARQAARTRRPARWPGRLAVQGAEPLRTTATRFR